MARRLLRWSIVLLGIAAAAVLAFRSLRVKPVTVAVWDMRMMDINETVTGVASGYIEPARRISVRPEISGRIKEVKVKRGDRVTEGQILAVLDDADLKDQIRALEAILPVFESRVKEAQSHAAKIRLDFARAQRLFEAAALSPQQFETAKMAIEVAAAEQEAAESALRQARVNRDIASSALRKTLVRAPFAGRVLDSSLEEGQLWGGLAIGSWPSGAAAAGAGRLETGAGADASSIIAQAQSPTISQGQIEIADDAQLFAVVDVDETDYRKLKLDQPAALTVEAAGQKNVTGRIVEVFPFISRALDQNRTARVRIRLDPGPASGLVSGMSANVEIIVSSRKNVLAAPAAAVLVRPAGRFVYRVAGGRLHETPVQTGISNWEWTEITGGLTAGDRIALRPDDAKLENGQRVADRDREP